MQDVSTKKTIEKMILLPEEIFAAKRSTGIENWWKKGRT